MKTLVTGANGLMGSSIVRELLKRGHEVRALVRKGAELITLEGLGIEIFYADLLDPERLEQACKGCDFVIHAGGKVMPAQTKFSDFAEVNINGTRNIVRAAENAGVARMVHVSSCCVFSGGSKDNPGTELSEFTGFRFNSGYINSKYLAQQWVLSEVEKKGFPIVIVNPTIMIGPYDARPSSSDIILRVLRQQILFCPDGGKNFIDSRDAAIGACNALTMGIPGECYLLGSDNLSYYDLFARINGIYGRSGMYITVSRMVMKSLGLLGNTIQTLSGQETEFNLVNLRQLAYESYFSAKKAVRALQLPQRPIDDAIRDATSWFIANGYLAPSLVQGTMEPVAA